MSTEPKVWTTRDGRRIPVDQMADSHLINAIKMMDRAHALRTLAFDLSAHRSLGGDAALLSVEQEVSRMYSVGASYSWPIYNGLMEEAVCRGLLEIPKGDQW